ncbi:MAG: hypothetical protein COA78_20450 [Blastopirellula sp.]|nr:MAG: hypothetical protein COA78_20450 [Blastopirellula sp.]
MFKALILSSILFMLSVFAASAETLKLRTDAFGEPFISFYGEVVDGSSARLAAMMDKSGTSTVSFYSGGGVAREAEMIGRVLSDRKATAIVPRGSFCLSACAEAFLGAQDYYVKGILGYHVSYFLGKPEGENFNSIFKYGQYVGGSTLAYTMANGFSVEMYMFIAARTDPNTFFVLTSTEELRDFYVRDDEEDVLDRYFDKSYHSPEWFEQHLWSGPQIGWYSYRQRGKIQ